MIDRSVVTPTLAVFQQFRGVISELVTDYVNDKFLYLKTNIFIFLEGVAQTSIKFKSQLSL